MIVRISRLSILSPGKHGNHGQPAKANHQKGPRTFVFFQSFFFGMPPIRRRSLLTKVFVVLRGSTARTIIRIRRVVLMMAPFNIARHMKCATQFSMAIGHQNGINACRWNYNKGLVENGGFQSASQRNVKRSQTSRIAITGGTLIVEEQSSRSIALVRVYQFGRTTKVDEAICI